MYAVNPVTHMKKERVFLFAGLIFLLTIFSLNIVYATGDTGGTSTMMDYINSGVFDGSGEPSQAEYWGMKIAKLVLSWALPLMSIYLITMITLSLVASVIYNVRPDICDDIHEAHKERKGGKNIIETNKSLWQNRGLAGLVKAYLPDFKQWAFADALESSDQGRPTLSHFAKNHLPKYMVLLALAMVIAEPTALKFLMNGAEVVAYPIRKASNMDWAEQVRLTVESGRDFNPQYNTKVRAEANKLKAYNSIYGTLKSLDKSAQARTTEFKTILGSNTRTYIETKMNNIDWDNNKLSVKSQYEPNIPAGVQMGDGRFAEPVSTFGLTTQTGYIVTYFYIEQTSSTYFQTQTSHRNGWNTVDTTPSSFDLTKVVSNATNQKITVSNSIVTFSVIGGSRVEQGTTKNNGSTISITKPQGIADDKILSMNLQITYTIANGNPIKLTATWANPKPNLTVQPKTP